VLYLMAADLTKMQVLANIDEADVGRMRPGQRVTFRVDAYPTDTFFGEVAQVRLQPTTVQNVVTYSTVISVPNPELKLKPGMTASVTIEIARRENALRVPSAAIRFRPTADIFASLKQAVPPELERGFNRGNRGGPGGGNGGRFNAGAPSGGPAGPPAASGASGAPAAKAPAATAPAAGSGQANAQPKGPRPQGTDGAPQARAEQGAGGQGQGGRGGPGGPGGFGMSPEERERFRNMTPEERQKAMEERMKNMTPEQRAAMEERRRQREANGGGGGFGPGGFGPGGFGPGGPGAGGRGSAGGGQPGTGNFQRNGQGNTGGSRTPGQGGFNRGGAAQNTGNSKSAATTSATTIDALFAPLQPVETRGRVWLYVGKQLKPVELRLGITDGTYTEVLNDPSEFAQTTEVVISVITPEMASRPAGQQNQANNPLMPQRGRGPGGPGPGGGGGNRGGGR